MTKRSSTLTIRVKDSTKKLLVDAAKTSGRSVAGEAIFRLEMMVWMDDLLRTLREKDAA